MWVAGVIRLITIIISIAWKSNALIKGTGVVGGVGGVRAGVLVVIIIVIRLLISLIKGKSIIIVLTVPELALQVLLHVMPHTAVPTAISIILRAIHHFVIIWIDLIAVGLNILRCWGVRMVIRDLGLLLLVVIIHLDLLVVKAHGCELANLCLLGIGPSIFLLIPASRICIKHIELGNSDLG